MRGVILLSWASVLFTSVLAQDPRVVVQHHLYQHDHSPPADPLETGDMSTAALTNPRHTSEGYFGIAKKFFDVAVLGKTPTVDLAARDQRDKEDGVERVTDANWGHTIGAASEGDVWVLLISTPPSHPIDWHYLDSHRNATALASTRGVITGMHWARADYMTEAEICTRWLVTRGPVLAVVTDRGKTVRFLQKYHLIEGGRGLYDLIESGEWKNVPVWASRYAPGGDRAYIIDMYIKYSAKFTTQTSKIPNLVWLGMFAGLTQTIMKWLHTRNTPRTAAPTGDSADAAASGTISAAGDGASSAGNVTRRAVEANRARLESERNAARKAEGRSRSRSGGGSSSSATVGPEERKTK